MNVKICGDDSLPVIVFLHGFTGSVNTWHEITSLLGKQFKTVSVDLIGHGQSAVPDEVHRYSMEELLLDLEVLFETLALDKFTLVGYSMGGRAALGYTLNYPQRVTSLILESASPGLLTEEERTKRREWDRILANRILKEGVKPFVDFWENIPLFDSQKMLTKEKQLVIRNERLRQNAIGLANSLLGMGTGSQPSYWNDLKKINCPVLLITGEFDKKFVNIAREMKNNIPLLEIKQ